MIDASASITVRMPRELRTVVEVMSKKRGESIATTVRDLIRDAAAHAEVDVTALIGNESVRPMSRIDK